MPQTFLVATRTSQQSINDLKQGLPDHQLPPPQQWTSTANEQLKLVLRKFEEHDAWQKKVNEANKASLQALQSEVSAILPFFLNVFQTQTGYQTMNFKLS